MSEKTYEGLSMSVEKITEESCMSHTKSGDQAVYPAFLVPAHPML
jgi:hypothetical protein